MGSNPTGPTMWPWDVWGLSYFFDNAVCETVKNHSRLEAIGKLLELHCYLFQLSLYSRRVPVFRDFHRKGIQLGS